MADCVLLIWCHRHIVVHFMGKFASLATKEVEVGESIRLDIGLHFFDHSCIMHYLFQINHAYLSVGNTYKQLIN